MFLKQFIAVLVVFLLFKYLSGVFSSKIQNYEGQMDALRVQQKNEQTYNSNKNLLLSLEPRFADISDKNEWLLTQIIDIFKNANLTPDIGAQSEDAGNPTYVKASISVNSAMEFNQLAELLASVENREEFVKVSRFQLEKNTDPNQVGLNKVSLSFNTVFPKEKIAKTLFKDYARLTAAQKDNNATKANNTAVGEGK